MFDDSKRVVVCVVRLMDGELLFRPPFPSVQGVECVPVGTGVHVGDVLHVHPTRFQSLAVNLSSSDDEALCFSVLTGQVQASFKL